MLKHAVRGIICCHTPEPNGRCYWQVPHNTQSYGPRIVYDFGQIPLRICHKAGHFIRECVRWRLEGEKICRFLVKKNSHLHNYTAWYG